jgi:hypothetical protein
VRHREDGKLDVDEIRRTHPIHDVIAASATIDIDRLHERRHVRFVAVTAAACLGL